jgi:hypothetical protein
MTTSDWIPTAMGPRASDLLSARAMARAELSRRVAAAVAYPPLSEMSDEQRHEFHEALLEADTLEDLPGKWQAAILGAEANRPNLRPMNGQD